MIKLKGKALKRAMKTNDTYRLQGDIPLIQDTTKLITPEIAEKMLRRNKTNRPINWNKVTEYRTAMDKGEWKLHAQGIVLDNNGNILTGQKRLWAIIYCGNPQYMRISTGSPPDTAYLLDRGTPQSSRDLASRKTERKHSPTEVSILRAIYALKGKAKPTLDELSDGLVDYDAELKQVMEQTRGIKKTKERMMILGVLCEEKKYNLFGEVEPLGELLIEALSPTDVSACWHRGAAFTLAMEKAKRVIENFKD